MAEEVDELIIGGFGFPAQLVTMGPSLDDPRCIHGKLAVQSNLLVLGYTDEDEDNISIITYGAQILFADAFKKPAYIFDSFFIGLKSFDTPIHNEDNIVTIFDVWV